MQDVSCVGVRNASDTSHFAESDDYWGTLAESPAANRRFGGSSWPLGDLSEFRYAYCNLAKRSYQAAGND